MTSIPSNIISTTEVAAARPGDTIFSVKSQPGAPVVVKKLHEPAPETVEESVETLNLEHNSALIRAATKKRMGVVRLRLARFGRKNAPFYRIHAADSRSPRDGKFLERVGYYDPRPGKDGHKRLALNFERAKYWLSVGAQPSDVVRRIFFIAGLLPRPPLPNMLKKGTDGSKGVGLAGVLDGGEENEVDEDIATIVE
ncbi:hypothetical protein L7F22_065485 [Adiantum nelumboides]|nr:hypothetical protein [Adiantum nelumboides]